MFRDELGFLSNYDTFPFEMPLFGGTVASGEPAFNALKTLDSVERAEILTAETPGQSKRLGRRATLRPGWNTGGRVRAMQQVLVAKFAVPRLAELLEATGDLALVETNDWHDQFWGSCFCPAMPRHRVRTCSASCSWRSGMPAGRA
ncbi:NADAR family protein [Streptomyces sp. NPDC007083]|uniref:NADAR family protein n=1 Tax=Streptomyces sp. NPDC007083 TaxID=3156913 RepID=UPI0033EA17E0